MSEDLKTRIDKATSLLQQGRLTSAHFMLKKVLQKEPDDVHALILSAELSLRNRKRPESVDFINKLFGMEPVNFGGALQKRLGHVCFESELYSNALQAFEWARLEEIQDDLSLFQLGISHLRLGDMQSAEQRFMECLNSRPEFADAYLQLGHVYKAMGSSKGAAEQYKKYIEFSPNGKGTGYWCLADLKSYAFDDHEIAGIKRELKT